jgi:hypothetical protein
VFPHLKITTSGIRAEEDANWKKPLTGRGRIEIVVEFFVFWHRRLAIIAKGASVLDNRSTGALFKENSLDLRGSVEREPTLTLPTKGSASDVLPLRADHSFASAHPYIPQTSAEKDSYEVF